MLEANERSNPKTYRAVLNRFSLLFNNISGRVGTKRSVERDDSDTLTIEQLPTELLLEIVDKLSGHDRSVLRRTSSTTYNAVKRVGILPKTAELLYASEHVLLHQNGSEKVFVAPDSGTFKKYRKCLKNVELCMQVNGVLETMKKRKALVVYVGSRYNQFVLHYLKTAKRIERLCISETSRPAFTLPHFPVAPRAESVLLISALDWVPVQEDDIFTFCRKNNFTPLIMSGRRSQDQVSKRGRTLKYDNMRISWKSPYKFRVRFTGGHRQIFRIQHGSFNFHMRPSTAELVMEFVQEFLGGNLPCVQRWQIRLETGQHQPFLQSMGKRYGSLSASPNMLPMPGQPVHFEYIRAGREMTVRVLDDSVFLLANK